MRTTFGNSEAVAREIGGHFQRGQDRIVRTAVGPVCKAIWGLNTDAHVATICQCTTRNARRYLSGELPIPATLLTAINIELVRRFE